MRVVVVGRVNARVPELLAHIADLYPALEQVRREEVPERVRRKPLDTRARDRGIPMPLLEVPIVEGTSFIGFRFGGEDPRIMAMDLAGFLRSAVPFEALHERRRDIDDPHVLSLRRDDLPRHLVDRLRDANCRRAEVHAAPFEGERLVKAHAGAEKDIREHASDRMPQLRDHLQRVVVLRHLDHGASFLRELDERRRISRNDAAEERMVEHLPDEHEALPLRLTGEVFAIDEFRPECKTVVVRDRGKLHVAEERLDVPAHARARGADRRILQPPPPHNLTFVHRLEELLHGDLLHGARRETETALRRLLEIVPEITRLRDRRRRSEHLLLLPEHENAVRAGGVEPDISLDADGLLCFFAHNPEVRAYLLFILLHMKILRW